MVSAKVMNSNFVFIIFLSFQLNISNVGHRLLNESLKLKGNVLI
jgi:hypothetical protein